MGQKKSVENYAKLYSVYNSFGIFGAGIPDYVFHPRWDSSAGDVFRYGNFGSQN